MATRNKNKRIGIVEHPDIKKKKLDGSYEQTKSVSEVLGSQTRGHQPIRALGAGEKSCSFEYSWADDTPIRERAFKEKFPDHLQQFKYRDGVFYCMEVKFAEEFGIAARLNEMANIPVKPTNQASVYGPWLERNLTNKLTAETKIRYPRIKSIDLNFHSIPPLTLFSNIPIKMGGMEDGKTQVNLTRVRDYLQPHTFVVFSYDSDLDMTIPDNLADYKSQTNVNDTFMSKGNKMLMMLKNNRKVLKYYHITMDMVLGTDMSCPIKSVIKQGTFPALTSTTVPEYQENMTFPGFSGASPVSKLLYKKPEGVKQLGSLPADYEGSETTGTYGISVLSAEKVIEVDDRIPSKGIQLYDNKIYMHIFSTGPSSDMTDHTVVQTMRTPFANVWDMNNLIRPNFNVSINYDTQEKRIQDLILFKQVQAVQDDVPAMEQFLVQKHTSGSSWRTDNTKVKSGDTITMCMDMGTTISRMCTLNTILPPRGTTNNFETTEKHMIFTKTDNDTYLGNLSGIAIAQGTL